MVIGEVASAPVVTVKRVHETREDGTLLTKEVRVSLYPNPPVTVTDNIFPEITPLENDPLENEPPEYDNAHEEPVRQCPQRVRLLFLTCAPSQTSLFSHSEIICNNMLIKWSLSMRPLYRGKLCPGVPDDARAVTNRWPFGNAEIVPWQYLNAGVVCVIVTTKFPSIELKGGMGHITIWQT